MPNGERHPGSLTFFKRRIFTALREPNDPFPPGWAAATPTNLLTTERVITATVVLATGSYP